MDSFFYMRVSDHAKLPTSFLKYTTKTTEAHTAVSSSREKRSMLRKTACRLPAQLPTNSP